MSEEAEKTKLAVTGPSSVTDASDISVSSFSEGEDVTTSCDEREDVRMPLRLSRSFLTLFYSSSVTKNMKRLEQTFLNPQRKVSLPQE
jgi:hypothetical protein